MNEDRQRPTLSAIITAARAGSLDHASALFAAGGHDRDLANPAALAVGARLLKDRALRAQGNEARALFAQAAAAYAQAYARDPQPYTRINQATLTLLSGDALRGQALARDLLAHLDTGEGLAETPYFLAATRAEALLLLGDRAAAEAALARAIAIAPDCAQDQASTLRQFRLILAARREDDGWLAAYRPARSLNFAGHLGIAEGDVATLGHTVADWLAREEVGAGFGALAAGADLVIAEVLLDHGAELHAVLPTRPDVFLAQSVAPYGPAWVRRFDRCLEEATSLRCLSTLSGPYEPLATSLAMDVAMGASVLHASTLETEALQLLIVDEAPGAYGGGRGTAYPGERWRAGGRAQHRIAVARSAAVQASGSKPPEGRADRCLLSMLHVGFEGVDGLDDNGFAQALDTLIVPFRAASANILPSPDVTLASGHAEILGFTDPAAAWRHAHALLALPQVAGRVRIAGHYALVHHLGDPPALLGPGVAALCAMAPVAMPGVLTASDTLAAAIFVNLAQEVHAEEVGAWRESQLFALTAKSPR